MGLFKTMRPLDINLEIPVSDKVEILPFYVFNERALNTFSQEVADEWCKKKEFFIEKIINIQTQRLSEILSSYLPIGQKVDFLTIDAEGFDFQILQSNDWSKYKPDIVLIESDIPYSEILASPINSYMEEQGFSVYAKTVKTYIFKNHSFIVLM
jgi:hypothetical protein